jgi:hypothetical protein
MKRSVSSLQQYDANSEHHSKVFDHSKSPLERYDGASSLYDENSEWSDEAF